MVHTVCMVARKSKLISRTYTFFPLSLSPLSMCFFLLSCFSTSYFFVGTKTDSQFHMINSWTVVDTIFGMFMRFRILSWMQLKHCIDEIKVCHPNGCYSSTKLKLSKNTESTAPTYRNLHNLHFNVHMLVCTLCSINHHACGGGGHWRNGMQRNSVKQYLIINWNLYAITGLEFVHSFKSMDALFNKYVLASDFFRYCLFSFSLSRKMSPCAA